MKMRLAIYMVLALLAVAHFALPGRAADNVVPGRTLGNFDRVHLNGSFDVAITAGATRPSVMIDAPPDIAARVTTTVTDSTLSVGMKPGNNDLSRLPNIVIETRTLHGLVNQGAGHVTITGLTGGKLAIENSGVAKIVASGRVDSESIDLDGTGMIDVADVSAHDATVNNNGVGSVHVRASGSLTMSVNGVGEIRYAGKPTHVESHVNGVGRIGPLAP